MDTKMIVNLMLKFNCGLKFNSGVNEFNSELKHNFSLLQETTNTW